MVVFENVDENISNPLSPLRIFLDPDYKYLFELLLSLEVTVSLFPTVL